MSLQILPRIYHAFSAYSTHTCRRFPPSIFLYVPLQHRLISLLIQSTGTLKGKTSWSEDKIPATYPPGDTWDILYGLSPDPEELNAEIASALQPVAMLNSMRGVILLMINRPPFDLVSRHSDGAGSLLLDPVYISSSVFLHEPGKAIVYLLAHLIQYLIYVQLCMIHFLCRVLMFVYLHLSYRFTF